MIRNLKAPMLASLALAALGAVLASGAQANPATSHFTSPFQGAIQLSTTKDEFEPVPPQTGPKTAHQVFDIRRSVGGTRSITCNEVVAHDTTIPDAADGTTTEITATLTFVGECQFLGQEVTVNTGACDFLLTADGTVHIKTDTGVTGECRHGHQPISFESIGCKVEIGEQTIGGFGRHTIEASGFKMITLEATNIENIQYNATGTNCAYGTTSNGILTTANTILTGRKSGTTEMVDIEWKTGT